jgi:hypothetical protein
MSPNWCFAASPQSYELTRIFFLSFLSCEKAGRTLPAGERGSAAGSLLSPHCPNYTWACVLCRPSPEFPFHFVWFLGWRTASTNWHRLAGPPAEKPGGGAVSPRSALPCAPLRRRWRLVHAMPARHEQVKLLHVQAVRGSRRSGSPASAAAVLHTNRLYCAGAAGSTPAPTRNAHLPLRRTGL